VADALVDILSSPHTQARLEAGEQLTGMALEDFSVVGAAVERALRRLPAESPALLELPYLLIETQQPEVIELLGKALRHSHPDVVAAAIEALAAFGEPEAIALLEPLCNDKRTSALGEDEGDRFEATLGELASDAIELLRAVPGAAPER
jgi:HEAT repeat protein